MIAPHGGRLINCMASDEEREKLLKEVGSMPQVVLNARETADLDMIAVGAMSPLEGFLGQDEYNSVLERMRLSNDIPWAIPIVLSTKPGVDAGTYNVGQDVALVTADGQTLGVLHLDSKWQIDKAREAELVLRTTDEAHPGVQYLNTIGDHYLGGTVTVLERVKYDKFNERRLDPVDTRVLFENKGFNTVVAFQTRNPIHRAHEYLTKCALEICDGLLIHPLMGETKSDDIPADVRMECYEVLLENYYPDDRTVLSVYPQAMRYAGPREAMLHALVRQNYGCSHFIVGRDHAGVGDYYGTYDAQKIFENFEPGEIGITTLNFEHSFFCKKTGGMASGKTSNSAKEDRVFLSGTKVRAMLKEGEMPPAEFTRPEVAKILIEAARNQTTPVAS